MPRTTSLNRKFSRRSSAKLFQGHRLRGSPRQRIVFTSTKQQLPVKDSYKVVKVHCHVPSPTSIANSGRNKEVVAQGASKTSVRNKFEERIRLFKERQQMVKDRYSPRMREIYVNKNAHNKANRQKTCSRGDKSEKTGKFVSAKASCSIKNSKTDRYESVDEILSEARKMIWFWLFNGLFPTNFQNKSGPGKT